MRSYRNLIAAGAFAVSSFALSAQAYAADIVDTAVGAGSFKTLVAAVQAAGLVDTLKGPGPFTVFAPSDEAFAKLPAGTVDDLLKPENKDKLVAILTYQVMMLLQHLIWETAAPEAGVGPVRIVVTILTGGALLLLLARVGPSESVDEMLGDSDRPLQRSSRKILITALVAIVSIAGSVTQPSCSCARHRSEMTADAWRPAG